MNLNTLRTFLTILETGSLVRASERLNVTQSTVTTRLKTLENALGQVLVNRYKSGVTPTASGLRLKRYAETMTELWRQARQETALPETISATCNIGCHPDLWPHLGQVLFDRIRQSQPGVALSVWHGGHGDLENWLNSGLTDVSITHNPTARVRQTMRRLPEDRMVLVSTCADAPVRFDPGYVFVEAGEEFGRAHAAAYADRDTTRLSFGSAVLGLEHILSNGGSAYLPERIAAPVIHDGKVYLIPGAPVFSRPAHLITNDSATQVWPWFESALMAVLPPQP